MTAEEQRAVARAGGKASVAKRREAKSWKEGLERLLAQPTDTTADIFTQACEEAGIKAPKSAKVGDLLLITLVKNAMTSPNAKFAELLRDQIGQKPADPEPAENNAVAELAVAISGMVKAPDIKEEIEADEEAGGHADEIPT